MEQIKKQNWLIAFSELVTRACGYGISPDELDEALKAGVTAYKDGVADEINPAKE